MDFEELLSCNKSLVESWFESTNLMINGAILKESRAAVETPDIQKRFTILAYLFLPLNLASSICEMNMKGFGTETQPFWLPAATLVALVLLTSVLMDLPFSKIY